MNNLFTYVSTIKNSSESKLIVDRHIVKETVEDDDGTTRYIEQVVKFENGVVIKQSMEEEVGATNLEVLCEECFINYEVISEPENFNITPKRKNFINHCQEAFWLKINAVQNT